MVDVSVPIKSISCTFRKIRWSSFFWLLSMRLTLTLVINYLFIIQGRKEREAQAAEGGWTVVAHHKGRKRTTEAESGTTMGSVAQAVVEDKMTNKKRKEVGLDFYRFQRREAQRNGRMNLIWIAYFHFLFLKTWFCIMLYYWESNKELRIQKLNVDASKFPILKEHFPLCFLWLFCFS